jgi:aspartate 1-decarboxylase
MRRTMFASKIHRATVTDANVDYEGSITLDRDLMDAANMLPYEQVHVWDVNNGSRLTTYILPGTRGSGTVCINGAAARLVEPGHRVILSTFIQLEEKDARKHQPRIILVNEKNRVVETEHREEPLQVNRV